MIFVECKPDLLLTGTITGKSKKEILHAGNKGEVIKHLSRSRKCTGLVDEDPGHPQPNYIGSMTLVRDDKTLDLKVYKDSKENLLIVLCPVFEEWILKTARLEKVSTAEFNLPEKGDRFHKMINLNLPKLEKLILRLMNSSRMNQLKIELSRN